MRLGTTVDDAVGEAFDKVGQNARPALSRRPAASNATALGGDPTRFDLPRPMLGRPNPDFSFSGLKTAVRHEAERIAPLTTTDVADLCASFQAAVVDTLVDRCRAGLRLLRRARRPLPTAMVVAGGVAANARDPPRARAALRREPGCGSSCRRRALHRQWRDDRLGGARAARARPHRRHGFRRAAALAARCDAEIPAITARREAEYDGA